MLHEALMLEIYRQALNAGALPNARPRSTESANSSERCPSHDSNSSENGAGGGGAMGGPGVLPLPGSHSSAFPAVPQNLAAQPHSMEAYLHMVAAAAQQYGFPLGAAAAAAAAGPRLPLPLATEAAAPFKLPPQASPTASSNHSEALDFRTHLFGRAASAEPPASEEEEEEEEPVDSNNPLDLSVGTRKRVAENDRDLDGESAPDAPCGQIQVKKIFKADSPPLAAPPAAPAAGPPMMPAVNPYLAAVAAANIFRTGQFPDWNGKSDLVVDPLEKMSDIVKGPRKEKSSRSSMAAASANAPLSSSSSSLSSAAATGPAPPPAAPATSTSSALPASTEGMSKARHNIWQSHWQNKGVASSVFRCVWCKQSFPTLEALTTHMKDSKHCGVNVPPFGNLPNTDRHHQHQHQHQHQPSQQPGPGPHHNQHGQHGLRKAGGGGNGSGPQGSAGSPSAAAKNAFQYRGDPPTPLPRKLVRGQNVWLGKGVEQAMQILKCMRCGESFRSLGDMTKHMQETQHYTNILSQEQTISMKSSGEPKEGQSSMSSEESRTLSAVLTCKVCDKAFNSLGDLSNHMAKNNHYAEPLMQSMTGAGGNRKRPAPKKREKSLPVRKLLEMKGAQAEADSMEAKMQRTFESAKRMSLEGTGAGAGPGAGVGPAGEKMEAAMFAERMRQYISGVKTAEQVAKDNLSAASLLAKTKSPELEPKNGATKLGSAGSSSVLSAIEQMFTTSFDTPPRHTSLPAASPSNSSNKNTSPVASSILKRLGIDETVDYNKPLMDTSDPYFQHYRYTSSERSGSECSVDNHLEPRKVDAPTPSATPEQLAAHAEALAAKPAPGREPELAIKKEPEAEKADCAEPVANELPAPQIKMEIKAELEDEEVRSPQAGGEGLELQRKTPNGADYSMANFNNNNNSNNNNNNNNNSSSSGKERSVTPPKGSPPPTAGGQRSPVESLRSATPKSPASSIKSYDGEKKYPSDSLNALSSMFDSLGSSASSTPSGRPQPTAHAHAPAAAGAKGESPENLSTSNSLAALRQFCVKKEKTA